MSRECRGPAPIVFFGYNRAGHAVRALESIKACPEVHETPITIFMDGPKNDAGAPAVEAARAAVQAAAPKHSRVVLRDENMGLANSIRAGVSEVCAEFGRVIVIEDDLVLSPAALTYFNRALERYRDDPRVMHISGYWPEISGVSLPPSFFIRWPSVWGWATWQRAWDHFEWDTRLLRDRLQAEWMVERLNEGGWDFFQNLLGTIRGDYDSWGIRWYASVLLSRGLALHPAKSLIANVGTDGSGVHLDVSSSFEVELGDCAPVLPDEVVESPEAVRAWAEFNRARTRVRTPREAAQRMRESVTAASKRLTGLEGLQSLPARMARRVQRTLGLEPRVFSLVTGAPRSGTTAVAAWLENQPAVCGLAESRILVAAHGLMANVERFRALYQRNTGWRHGMRRLVLDAYTSRGVMYARRVLIDKEPLEPIAFPDLEYDSFLRHCRAVFPDLRIIFLVRDPVATVWSMTQREWGSSRRDIEPSRLTFETHLRTWIDCADLAVKLRDDPLTYVCRYETLVEDPIAESVRIARFLALTGVAAPFEPRPSDTVGFSTEERARILAATAGQRASLGL